MLLNSCCYCCCSLRFGVIVYGFFDMLVHLTGLLMTIFYTHGSKFNFVEAYTAQLAIHVFCIIVLFFLLIGAFHESRFFLFPYMIVYFFVIMAVIASIVTVFIMPEILEKICLAVLVPVLVFYAYAWLCTLSYYILLKEEEYDDYY